MIHDIRAFQDKLVRAVTNTRIYNRVGETPLAPARALSKVFRAPVFIKREDLHPVFSFKIRGAYHKMSGMRPARLKKGVVAASAGNHAQGVAWAARQLGSHAVIVMPAHTQHIKVAAVRALGAQVILEGELFDEAYLYAKKLAAREGMTFIPPFDDADIIAGNATIAAEILRQHPEPIQAIFCAIGGGGLISGIAAYAKAFRPDIRIIGVEAEDSASMSAALKANAPVSLPRVGIFADAVAVKKAGRLTYDIVKNLVDGVVTVNNDAICAGIKDIYDDTRVIVEPSGALAIAGAKKYARRHRIKKPIIAVACGANMNFDRLRFVAERAEIGENREILLSVTIPEEPGSFHIFCNLLGKRSITEFNYRMSNDSAVAHIFVGVEISSAQEKSALIKRLRQKRLEVLDLTDDEMSKLHIRHMVGGRARAADERLFRFEFPERPGALRAFLESLAANGNRWNISLFHYRNYGGDVGRVLCGIQVPQQEVPLCEERLNVLGYPFYREDHNRAYRLFLWQK